MAVIHDAGTRPASSKAMEARASSGRTPKAMTSANRMAKPTVWITPDADPAAATALATATRNQALTSSTAAEARTTAPTGRPRSRRSTMIRASTGKAVIDMDTPMNRAKAAKGLFGASNRYTGSAMRSPRSWRMSSSRPTRNM